jgi:small subunit ribosomal protein S18
MAEIVKKKTQEDVKPTLDDVFDDSKVTEEEDTEETKVTTKRRPRGRRRRFVQNLKCPLCESGKKSVSYKEIYQLKKYTSVRGKIISTEKSGVCNKHQRQITRAIKRARYLALLPYSLDE